MLEKRGVIVNDSMFFLLSLSLSKMALSPLRCSKGARRDDDLQSTSLAAALEFGGYRAHDEMRVYSHMWTALECRPCSPGWAPFEAQTLALVDRFGVHVS